MTTVSLGHIRPTTSNKEWARTYDPLTRSREPYQMNHRARRKTYRPEHCKKEKLLKTDISEGKTTSGVREMIDA